jgi:hypothetical protein
VANASRLSADGDLRAVRLAPMARGAALINAEPEDRSVTSPPAPS